MDSMEKTVLIDYTKTSKTNKTTLDLKVYNHELLSIMRIVQTNHLFFLGYGKIYCHLSMSKIITVNYKLNTFTMSDDLNNKIECIIKNILRCQI
jgi:hypothetical protein